jgi:hypothetical protein
MERICDSAGTDTVPVNWNSLAILLSKTFPQIDSMWVC